MSEENTPVPTPERRLTVEVDGQKIELFMSFGLLDKVIKKFNTDGVSVETAMMDDESRLSLVEFMFEKRGKYGWQDEANKFDADTSEITSAQVAEIFKFVLENVTDFFVKSGDLAVEVLTKYKDKLASLEPSATGSQS